MQVLKKYLKKAERSLEQIVRRCIEKEKNLCASTVPSNPILTYPNLISLHHNGPLISDCKNPQYKIIKYNGITFKTTTLSDSCCGLSCGAIVCIENVTYCKEQNIPVVIGYEFLKKEDLYIIPCSSSILGIYSVSLCSNIKSWPLKNIVRKYMKLPNGIERYAVFPLIHYEI